MEGALCLLFFMTIKINGNISKLIRDALLKDVTDYYIITDGYEIDELFIKKAFSNCIDRIVSIPHECIELGKEGNIIYTNEIRINFAIIPFQVAERFKNTDFQTLREYTNYAFNRGTDIILYGTN
jgi:hypothetical protein